MKCCKSYKRIHVVQLFIEKSFLKLIKKHFPRDHKLYKIFNRSTLKLR